MSKKFVDTTFFSGGVRGYTRDEPTEEEIADYLFVNDRGIESPIDISFDESLGVWEWSCDTGMKLWLKKQNGSVIGGYSTRNQLGEINFLQPQGIKHWQAENRTITMKMEINYRGKYMMLAEKVIRKMSTKRLKSFFKTLKYFGDYSDTCEVYECNLKLYKEIIHERQKKENKTKDDVRVIESIQGKIDQIKADYNQVKVTKDELDKREHVE